MRFRFMLVAAGLVAAPLVILAQNGDLTQQQPATPNANVDFGVLPPPAVPLAPQPPLGPLPCLQSGGIGGPNDPCAFKLHHLTPEEVTIDKGGQVTFQIHGGGHAMAIYEVSKDTTRDDIGTLLCGTNDPTRMTDPAQHSACNLSPQANDPHFISDAKGNVVLDVSANVTNLHPDNRAWYEPGRLMSAGGVQFLNGGAAPAGTGATGGQLVTYRFLRTGRYLVHCMNRVHFLNDWMFGFVNVVGE